jgi:hypothetical protein
MKIVAKILMITVAMSMSVAFPAGAFADATAASPALQKAAASMVKDMRIAVASDSSRTERQIVVHRLKKMVANMNPAEKLRLTDELITTLDRAMNNQLAMVKAYELPTFFVAMSGLVLLLTLHPQRLVGAKSFTGLVALGGAVYVQEEYLSPENIQLHAAQLRSELYVLRRTIELNQSANALN